MVWVKIFSGFKIRKIKPELLHLGCNKDLSKNGAIYHRKIGAVKGEDSHL
jgi:hypothetical protein